MLFVIFPLFLLIFILSLSLIFVSLITMCLSVFLLGFILPGTLCASWTWVTISFPMLGKFSTIISSNIFSELFCSLFSFWDPYNVNVGVFHLVPELSKAVFSSFHSFFLFCSAAVISIIQSSRSFIHFSASVLLLLIPSSVLFICFFALIGLL